MGAHHTGVGHQAVNHVLEHVEALDTRGDEEDLTAARELEVDGLAHGVVAKAGNGGCHGAPVGRGRVEVAEVAAPMSEN